jgi:uncharacterized NAD(P)/FAD-binding protein YdhS
MVAAISSLAAAASLWYTAKSLGLTRKSQKRQDEAELAQVQHTYYKRMVVDRVFYQLAIFRTEAKEIVTEYRSEIRKMHDNNIGSNIIDDTVIEMATSYQNRYGELQNAISESIHAWDDDKLTNDVYQKLEHVEDDVVALFEELIKIRSNPKIFTEIDSSTGAVEKVIRNSDPVLKASKTVSHPS